MQFYSDIYDITEPICYIVGAGDFAEQSLPLRSDDLLIAADGGLKHLQSVSIAPNIIVGDFDSLDEAELRDVPTSVEIVCSPVIKDETDTYLAVQVGLKRGYKYFVIYGGTGGKRPSHTYANYTLLSDLARRECQGFLIDSTSINNASVDKTAIASAIHNGQLHFSAQQSGHLSVFATLAPAQGVSITGAQYELGNATLDPAFSLGVSNRLTGQPATIAVDNGTLLIIHEPE